MTGEVLLDLPDEELISDFKLSRPQIRVLRKAMEKVPK